MVTENQKDMTLLECVLKMVNSCLSHKFLFMVTLWLPVLVAFVLVMWVIKPEYSAEAVVTPPNGSGTSAGSLSKLLDGAGGLSSMSSLLGGGDDGKNIVWTYFNSWELHNKVIEKFNLADHYEFDGNFHADLLKLFRKKFSLEENDEEMFHVTFVDEDHKLAANILSFMLANVDSMYNSFKTTQARQSRLYMNQRLEEVMVRLDSLEREFVNFQQKNHVYDPEVQVEGTMKYLASLQTDYNVVSLALDKERVEHGENTKLYRELNERVKKVENTRNQALGGRQSNIGVLSLSKVPGLAAEYTRMEKEIRMQGAIYTFLKQESERLYIEESNLMSNLIVLLPPWDNDKKIRPLRGVTLVFVFSLSFILAVSLCCFIEYCRSVDPESSLGKEISKFSRKIRFK